MRLLGNQRILSIGDHVLIYIFRKRGHKSRAHVLNVTRLDRKEENRAVRYVRLPPNPLWTHFIF
jgi:hypothetical protein